VPQAPLRVQQDLKDQQVRKALKVFKEQQALKGFKEFKERQA
jgi:hypothetical protein